MGEVTLGDRLYRIGRMNVNDQFHVARRLLPLVADILPAAQEMFKLFPEPTKEGEEPKPAPQVNMTAALQPLLGAIGKLKDEDCDYIIAKCLAVVSRQDANGQMWANVWNGRAGRLQYEDISLPEMLQLTGHVIMENIADFSPALGSVSTFLNQKSKLN